MSETEFKSGFVVLLGRPSAGKSTLLNALLKSKLSIVSPKPQTTRHRILGILDGPGYQACFLDTPGLIPEPQDDLQVSMRRQAMGAAHEDPDVMILLVDPVEPSEKTLAEFAHLRRLGKPLLLAFNKSDLPAAPGRLERVYQAYMEALKPDADFKISALKGDGVPALLAEVLKRLPASPAFYEVGQLTDRYERFFAAELIREAVFDLYGEEIPHATAVVIERFREAAGQDDELSAVLYVERETQKGIIIGKGGQALRQLQEQALDRIEEFLDRPVQLEIWVKVRKNWRKDPRSLKEFGYLT